MAARRGIACGTLAACRKDVAMPGFALSSVALQAAAVSGGDTGLRGAPGALSARGPGLSRGLSGPILLRSNTSAPARRSGGTVYERAVASMRGAATFEHAGDGAEEILRNRPEPGGFLRGNFIKEHGSANSLTDAYELKCNIGCGAFGSVCAATHRTTGNAAAVKSVPKKSPAQMAALKAEIGFLQSTDHPHICRLYETFEDESNVYLVMEQCSGGELWQRVLDAHDIGLGYGERELARAVQQMLRALAYCHSHGIVHRDVKPQNFLYESEDEGAVLKLVDFGVSGVVAHETSGERERKRYLTRMVGTDGYIAPEVLLSRPYGTAADMFSVGATMHAAVVGLAPIWEQKDGKPPAYRFPGKLRWRTLPKEARELLTAMLSPDPEARPTASDALGSPWFNGLEAGPDSRDCQGCLMDEEYVLRMRKFAGRSKLQKCAFASVAAFTDLHCEEVNLLRNAFLAADTDDSGEVSPEELAAALGQSDGTLKVDVADILKGVDTSHQGSITFCEFLTAAASRKLLQCESSARHAYDALDINGDGFVSATEIEAALPGVMSRQELLEGISRVDRDGDGLLNYEEFIMLLRGSVASIDDL